MSVRTRPWYDRFYKKAERDPKHQYGLDPDDCVYSSMWKKALSWIKDTKRILDVGCGPGQFAEMAIRGGKRYMAGVDFSSTAIRWAKRRNPAHAKSFVVRDFSKGGLPRVPYDVAVILEVLEHIDDDLGIVGAVASGSQVVFSVPNYSFTSHVRHFQSPGDARERYERLLRIDHLHEAPMPGGNKVWLFNAWRA